MFATTKPRAAVATLTAALAVAVAAAPAAQAAGNGPAGGSPATSAQPSAVQRTSRPGIGKPPVPVVTVQTNAALEVDGVPGGYSRQKCERLAGQWEQVADKAMSIGASSGPEAESATRYLQQAEEIYQDMSDNCMIVDPA